jgi:hypothetical protein
MEQFQYNRSKYDHQYQRWMPEIYTLPRNSYNGYPILLCPKSYLRDLPTISADNFWDYCFSNANETLRNDFGADITRNVDKKTIVNCARYHPELRESFIAHVEETASKPYDYNKDKRGLIKWYAATASHCQETPLTLSFTTQAQFISSIESMISEFTNFVGNNRGWSLLWNDNGTPKSEEASQLLFLGIVKHYCHANNIDISKEVNIGRGPVDFKTSRGYQFRALLELKLAKNSRFWNGLAKQLPKYQEAEGISTGFFIVIVYTENDLKKISEIQLRVREVNEGTGYDIRSIIVDARSTPLSASRL